MSVKPVDLKKLDAVCSNVYEAVVVASKKAREINNDMKLEFEKRIKEIVVKKETDDQEEIENPEQLKISLEFEKYGKPTMVALNAVLNNKVKYQFKS